MLKLNIFLQVFLLVAVGGASAAKAVSSGTDLGSSNERHLMMGRGKGKGMGRGKGKGKGKVS
jgi:hypothetical protein